METAAKSSFIVASRHGEREGGGGITLILKLLDKYLVSIIKNALVQKVI